MLRTLFLCIKLVFILTLLMRDLALFSRTGEPTFKKEKSDHEMATQIQF